MDGIVLFLGILFLVLLGFYSINLYLPHRKRLKYIVSFCFFTIGVVGWIAVWIRLGWLGTAVISSAFILLAVCSFIIAWVLDLVAKYSSN